MIISEVEQSYELLQEAIKPSYLTKIIQESYYKILDKESGFMYLTESDKIVQ